VLVTGGAGYVGGHVVHRLLAAGARVGVLDDFSCGSVDCLQTAVDAGLRDRDVTRADITRPEAQTAIIDWRPEVVVHLAAQPRVVASVGAPVHDATTNIVGTLRVLEACVQAKVRKVVFASSGGAVFGRLPVQVRRATETTPRVPLSPYGLSKATADSYLRLYRDLYGLTFTSLAVGNVYGPHLDGRTPANVIGSFAADLLAGRRPTLHGSGTQTRDFVHITDVAEAFHLACSAGDNAYLNVGTGVQTTVNRVFSMVAQAVGGSGECRPESAEARPGEVRQTCLDPARARALLGWRAKVALPDGIGDFVHHLRDATLRRPGVR
jgi:UDP-glucose 4-epimerase